MVVQDVVGDSRVSRSVALPVLTGRVSRGGGVYLFGPTCSTLLSHVLQNEIPCAAWFGSLFVCFSLSSLQAQQGRALG